MEKYRLVKKIGQGSFGEVWLVKGSKTQKQYVLKQINLHHASKREQRAAHLEVKLLSTLKHPNIVSYLDSFYNRKGSLFIVMGYCENGDLYTLIRNQNGVPFPEKNIVEWLIQICMALKYLHDKKILHRDLKTQNIFLTRSNLIKVGDLGIARVLDRTTDMATTMIGTPYYMSPEIFCNKPYSFKSDVWALGCCIYEIATMKHAFHAGNFTSVMQSVLNRKVPGIQEQYSQEFQDIIFSMFNIDPEKRPSITDILLDSYVRRHIVTFLEETKSSAKLLAARSPKPTTSCGENECVSHEVIPGSTSGKEKSKETLDIPNISSSKEHVFQTPDINGNGDGNDNSQQQRCAMNNTWISQRDLGNIPNEYLGLPGPDKVAQDLTLLTANPMKPCSNNECRSSVHSSMITSDSRASDPECVDKMGKSNYSARRALKSLQRNGQMSLNFLRNLTLNMNTIPNYSFPSNCKKAVAYHSTVWDYESLPVIFTDAPATNTPQFGFDHKKSKRFKSSKRFQNVGTGELKRSSSGSFSKETQIIDDTEQKENVVCPRISSANVKKYQLTVYRGSKIPIFNVTNPKEVKDLHTGNKGGHFNSLFPDISQNHLSLFTSNIEDCSTESNHIDGSLLHKIINCNIKGSTIPGNLNSAARQRRRERENRKTKTHSAKPATLALKRSMKENVDNDEIEICCRDDVTEKFIN